MVVVLAAAIGYAGYKSVKKTKQKRSERRKSKQAAIEQKQIEDTSRPVHQNSFSSYSSSSSSSSANDYRGSYISETSTATPHHIYSTAQRQLDAQQSVMEYYYDAPSGDPYEVPPPYDPGNYSDPQLHRLSSTRKEGAEPRDVHPALRNSEEFESGSRVGVDGVPLVRVTTHE